MHTYTREASSSPDTLANAFHAQFHVTIGSPIWHVDSGATSHMSPNYETLHEITPYQGNMSVVFGYGKSLPITHTNTLMVSNKIFLRDVLVIPNLTKKVLSISKVTTDYPVDVLFTQAFLVFRTAKQNRF